MTTPPDIFLSYNREDQARAKLFAEAFDGQGFKVWWDVGLQTGKAYNEVMETALRTAKAVVVNHPGNAGGRQLFDLSRHRFNRRPQGVVRRQRSW
jgi:hypothetical protein